MGGGTESFKSELFKDYAAHMYIFMRDMRLSRGVMIFFVFDSVGGKGLCKVEIPKDNEEVTKILACS